MDRKNWTIKVAKVLECVDTDDIIVVPTEDMLVLVQGASKRMNVQCRLMMESEYNVLDVGQDTPYREEL